MTKKTTTITSILALGALLSLAAQSVEPGIVIGNQTWAADNLNVSTFRNGDPIPEAQSNAEWEKAGREKQPAWCYYAGDPKNGETYGKLYNWYAVTDPRGLAPEGWHVPSLEEWHELAAFLGGADRAGIKLKSRIGWDKGGNGRDTVGFAGIPGGGRGDDNGFFSLGLSGYLWTTTEDESNPDDARYRSLYHDKDYLGGNPTHKRNGLYVRCLKD